MYFVALLLRVRKVEEARTMESSVSHDIQHVLADYYRSHAASHQQQYGITVTLLRCKPRNALLRLTICSREMTPVSAILESTSP